MGAHEPRRFVEQVTVFLDPGIGVDGGPRLRQMRLGLDPHSQRLLGETELSGRARAARHGVGALEVRQRRLLLVLPAQLQTLANQVIGIDGGGRRVGQRAQGNERGEAEEHQHQSERVTHGSIHQR